MKARVRFSKQGNMKYVGHLDLMRYFQKAIRRSRLDIAYSNGFHPHMIMSFASPLGIGLTSDAEYMDIELKTPVSSKEAIETLNSNGVEGILVTGFVKIPENKASGAMANVAAADYQVNFRKGHEPKKGWEEKFSSFMEMKSIPVLKKTKRSEKEMDIRPMIYDWSVNDGSVFLRLASGSTQNLKPDLVMDTFLLTMLQKEPDPVAYEINRQEIYADLGTNGNRRFVSLYELGDEI